MTQSPVYPAAAKRHSRVVIDLSAIVENYRYLKSCAPESRLIAVVKANAYGHGVIQVSRALASETDAFAVATLPEAVELRQAGIRQPVIVLGGIVNSQEMQISLQQNISLVVHQLWQIDLLDEVSGPAVDIWVKINTGMGRLGFDVEQLAAALERLRSHPRCAQLRLMTHFACADEADNQKTQQQLARMLDFGLQDYEWGVANSAGLIAWPQARLEWVRSGIALYGIDPMDHPQAQQALRPAMAFSAQVLAVYSRQAGETIGYGAAYLCQHETQIAVISAGYADGYPRHLENGWVLINGEKAKVVGRVSMDMMTVDVTGMQVAAGDEVILWNHQLLASDVARASETIAYELFCHAGCHAIKEYR